MLLRLRIPVFIFVASAAVLQPFQSLNSQRLKTNGSEIFLLSNATTGGAETTQFSNLTGLAPIELGAVRGQCNAQVFGSNLNVASCQDAFANIIPDDTSYSWGMRHDGHVYGGALPYQWLSVRALRYWQSPPLPPLLSAIGRLDPDTYSTLDR